MAPGLLMTPAMRLRFNRRHFLRLALYGSPVLAVADMALVEPHWLKVTKLKLGQGTPTARLVHFTDQHFKGDRAWLARIVAKINALKPDFVCFTGDLIEEKEHLAEALELVQQIKVPVYGVPGNHDYWSNADFADFAKAFAATGGAWLMDASALVAGGQVQLLGLTCHTRVVIPPKPGVKNILLAHYPIWCERVAPHRYDLMLAGHSHGGQVRVPFYGPLITPFNVGRYNLGRYETPTGPLYVGAGTGWFYLNLRFCCRPEITLVEI